MNTVFAKFKKAGASLSAAAIASTPYIASAAAPVEDARVPGEIPTDSGVAEGTVLIDAISTVVNWALGFIGIVVFLLFLFAGFQYATAGGDEAATQAARSRMINAVIGLIIIFFAFVASNAILSFALQDTTA